MKKDTIKLVIVGDSATGKSSILSRFSDDSFTENFMSTIGVDFRFRSVKIGGETIKLHLWDTAGQERFRTITNAYYRGTEAVMIVFDITNRQSFLELQGWHSEVMKHTVPDLPVIIVGNKTDLCAERSVTSREGSNYATSIGALYIETSAKENENVTEAFTVVTERILQTRRSHAKKEAIELRTLEINEGGFWSMWKNIVGC